MPIGSNRSSLADDNETSSEGGHCGRGIRRGGGSRLARRARLHCLDQWPGSADVRGDVRLRRQPAVSRCRRRGCDSRDGGGALLSAPAPGILENSFDRRPRDRCHGDSGIEIVPCNAVDDWSRRLAVVGHADATQNSRRADARAVLPPLPGCSRRRDPRVSASRPRPRSRSWRSCRSPGRGGLLVVRYRGR